MPLEHTYVFLIHIEGIKIGFELTDFGFYLDFGKKKQEYYCFYSMKYQNLLVKIR